MRVRSRFGRGDALLEGGHQLLDRGPPGRGRLLGGALRRRAFGEHAEKLLPVGVGVRVGIPFRLQGLDERDREVQLPLVDLDAVQVGSEIGRVSDLVAEEHRLDGQHLLHRADRHEVRLGSQHEPPDPDPPRLAHRVMEQDVRLGRLGRHRDRVVALVEVDGVDLLELDEILDVDGSAPFGTDPLELLPRHRHEFALVGLDAAHDVIPRDRRLDGSRGGRALLARAVASSSPAASDAGSSFGSDGGPRSASTTRW